MMQDISARSPVSYSDNMQSRTSLDSRFSRITSPSAMHTSSFEKPPSMEEECFEDVGLNDEEAKPKKKGIFARFGDFSSDNPSSGNPPKTGLGFHLPGRKRGQSGTGSELGNMKPPSAGVEAKDS